MKQSRTVSHTKWIYCLQLFQKEKREKKYVRLENCNINLYHNKTHESMKDQELSRSLFGLEKLS